MSEIIIRELKIEDFNNGFITTLKSLTEVGEITFDEFKLRFNLLKSKQDYFIVVAVKDDRIVGAGTLVVEYKFIRNCAKKGHIEDIVVDKDYQRQGIGKKIVLRLIEESKNRGCYKTALVTAVDTVGFYERCGFKEKERELVIYHDS